MILSSFLLALALCPQVGALPAGQPPRDAAPRPEATGSGIIRGHVIAADTGTPVRRANVTLSITQNQASMTGRGQVNSGSMSSRQTTADAQGAFEFRNLPPGSYRVFASPGQFSAQYLGVPYGSKRPIPGESGTPIDLAPGQVFDRATIGLPRGAVIVGRVTDEMGDPIARAQVSGLWFPAGSSRGQRNSPGVQTDDLGQFRLYGLLSGEYVVSVEARSPTFVPPNMPQQREEDSTGLLTTYYPGTADEASAQHVRTAAGRETNGVEIRMVAGRLYRISGMVMDSRGRPGSNVNASLIQRTSVGMTSGSGFSTDAQGRFQMRNVAPGTYRLMVRPRMEFIDGKPNPQGEMANIPLTIDGDLDNIVITTTAGVTVSGQIVFDPSPPPEATGQLRVTAVRNDPLDGFGMNPQAALVQPDLTFTLKGVVGEFLLRTGMAGAFLKSVTLGGDDITDTPREFKAGDRVTIVLTSRASTLEGNVTGATGAPAADAGVIMFSEDKATWRMSSTGVHRSSSDASGHFRMEGLRPGRYYLVAAPRERVFLPGFVDASFFEGLIKDATIIVIGEDEQRTMDVRVVDPGEIP